MNPIPTIDDLRPWLEERFDRSGGPGGQHVNKVSTRVTLLLDYRACPAFSDFQKTMLTQRLSRRLASDGRLRILCDSDRSQSANRQEAEQKLMELLAAALHVQRPRTATRPTRGSQRRRVNDKRKRGEIKRLRGGGAGGEN